jgi:RHS repeat-associated protein
MTMRRTITLILAASLGIGFGPVGWPGQPLAQDPGEVPRGRLPGASATLLSDGRWLVAGGQEGRSVVRSAALVDPEGGETTTLAAGLRRARAWHATAVLPDGTVLVTGGLGGTGRLVRRTERFDPSSQTFAIAAAPLTPHAHHTATVLTDGRVLLVGGTDAQGETLATAELWDPRGGGLQSVAPLGISRADHTATLLPDGRVLIWGGRDASGNPLDSGEVFDPATRHFQPLETSPVLPNGPAQMAASIPTDGAADVAPDARLAVRFSAPVTVTTVTADTVTLTGAAGAVAVHVVAAEEGRLVFVTPEDALDPGSTYTLTLAGIADATGMLLPAEVRFSTRATPAAGVSSGSTAAGGATGAAPGAASDDTMADSVSAEDGGRGHPPWQELPPLEAPPGVTALTGQVLDVDGKPIPGVLLQVDAQVTESDQTGRFLLTGLTCAHCVLIIDGRPASRPRRTYGVFEFGQDIEAGTTNMVMGTLWMPRIDTAHAVDIPSPTSQEIVITTPRIPGLELHLPPNAVIRDKDGNVVHQVSITPFSKTRPIMMPPNGFEFPVFFTIQPGGAHVETPDGTGVWLVYPNPTHLPPYRAVPFMSYDPRDKDWFVYGLGHVSPDGRRIVADPGTTFTEFHCHPACEAGDCPLPAPDDCSDDTELASSGVSSLLADSLAYAQTSPANPQCSPTEGAGSATPTVADPVDGSTGVFVHKEVDLQIADVIPIAVTRAYESQDLRPNKFGIGMSHSYEMHLYPVLAYTKMDLIKPDRSVVHYTRISSGDGFRDAVFEHTGSPTKAFFKSRITWNGQGWDLTLHDGSVYVFGPNYALQAIRNRLGAQVTITRENGFSGRITRVTSPSGRFIDFTYGAHNGDYISQISDNTGRTVTYGYNGDYLQTVTDPNGKTTTYGWGQKSPRGVDRLVKITDRRNIQYLKNTYDPQTWRVTQQDLADGGSYILNYTLNSSGIVTDTVVTDPRGIQREITYNAGGYPLTDTRAKNKPEQQTVTFTRNPSTHQVQTVTDALGRVTKFDYESNGSGNVAAITRMYGTAAAAKTSYNYDQPGNGVHSVTDPLGHTTTTWHNDPFGRPTLTSDPLGHQTTYQYDPTNNPFGQVSSVTDPLNHTTHYGYDLGDLATVTDPLGHIVQHTYDALGRVSTTTDPLGYTTTFTYWPTDQLKTRTDPQGGMTSFAYDEDGNLQTSTDPKNHPTTFNYGNLDRMSRRTDPLNRYDQFTYDTDGNVTLFRDGGAVYTAFTYDDLNRPACAAYNQTMCVNPPTADGTVTFDFDAANRLTQATDTVFGTITRTYDDVNRQWREQSCPTGESCRTITYTTDAAGRRQTMTPPSEVAVSYAYYDDNRLQQITQGGAAVTFTYDAAGRRTRVGLPNGVSINYGYYDDSRVSSLTYKQGNTVLGDLSYTYDAAGHQKTVGGSWARTNVPAPVTSTVYDNGDELASWNGTTIPNDAQGDLKGDGTNTYYWNARRQLREVASNTRVVQFFYDPFGRRWKKVDGATVTEYAYDGLTPVQELDGTGAVTATLLTGTDEIYRRSEVLQSRYFLTDVLGSTVALTDDTGAVTTQYAYEPFGRATVQNLVGTSTNPYQYAGRENDGTGLYYNRARYYHPVFGRFISADPLAQSPRFPGVNDLYVYADDAPTTFTDPLGLDPHAPFGSQELIQGAVAIGAAAAVLAETGDPSDLEATLEETEPEFSSLADYIASKIEALPDYLYHYTTDDAAQSIDESAFLGKEGGTLYLTPSSDLSPIQAGTELSLPQANTAEAVFQIPTSALDPDLISKIGNIEGNVLGRGGGGAEIVYEGRLPMSLVTRVQ